VLGLPPIRLVFAGGLLRSRLIRIELQLPCLADPALLLVLSRCLRCSWGGILAHRVLHHGEGASRSSLSFMGFSELGRYTGPPVNDNLAPYPGRCRIRAPATSSFGNFPIHCNPVHCHSNSTRPRSTYRLRLPATSACLHLILQSR
jgi:hypothetical protein